MKFIGLILGIILGTVIGQEIGFFLGALLGFGSGFAMDILLNHVHAEKIKEYDIKMNHIYKSLQDIHWRLVKLEKPGEMMEAAPKQTTPASTHPIATEASHQAIHQEIINELRQETNQISNNVQEQLHTEMLQTPTELKTESMSPKLSDMHLPDKINTTKNLVRDFFFGGNALVRFGVIILFFGVAFLLKYAADLGFFPIEVRLIGVAIGAIVMLLIGWRLRTSRTTYALVLQGGGVGILYLTVFTALRLYHLVPAEVALLLLIGIAVFSAMLAILQDSRSLAVASVTGGFLAPILASTGSGNHVMLFSYYAVINLGIVVMAWYKTWRPLNILGLLFTFVIGSLWGAKYYRPEFFVSTEPFLILFFLFYVLIAVFYAAHKTPDLKNYIDGTIVFGNPLLAFGLQTALVKDFEYGAAYSALALSLLYLALATLLYTKKQETLRLLVEAFLALGVVFGTLAIPLAFEGRLTSAAWALEGAAIVWIGVRQNKALARAFGILLQFAAGAAFLFDSHAVSDTIPILNSFAMGCGFISVAALFCSYYLQKKRLGSGIAEILFFWGIAWWIGGGIREIHRHLPPQYELHIFILFITITSMIFSIFHHVLQWSLARLPALALLPILMLLALIDWQQEPHAFANLGYIVWPLALISHFSILYLNEERHNGYMCFLHYGSVWLIAGLLSWEIAWAMDQLVSEGQGRPIWSLISWGLVPSILILLLMAATPHIKWPLAARPVNYLVEGIAPIAIALVLWTVYVNFTSNGDPAPLSYLPIINPLDLAEITVFVVLATWIIKVRQLKLSSVMLDASSFIYTTLGVVIFIWLNGVLIRTLHHWAHVAFNFKTLFHSNIVQTSFSIFWSTLALCVMITASRYKLRSLWITGASLMALVVIKLFFIDLSSIGTVERIISFIGVGILMLIIGYLSPVPPLSPSTSRLKEEK